MRRGSDDDAAMHRQATAGILGAEVWRFTRSNLMAKRSRARRPPGPTFTSCDCDDVNPPNNEGPLVEADPCPGSLAQSAAFGQ